MTTPIHFAAQAVAEARHIAEIATAAVIEAESHVSALIDRHLALQEKKGTIAAERSSGIDAPEHGAQLALIALDSEDLNRLVAEAEAVAEKAKAEAATASAHVVTAVQKLAHATSEETLARLKPIATELMSKLDLAVQQIMAEAKSLGQRAHWAPSDLEFQRLNRLYVAKGML
jgi:hypothetical protein